MLRPVGMGSIRDLDPSLIPADTDAMLEYVLGYTMGQKTASRAATLALCGTEVRPDTGHPLGHV